MKLELVKAGIRVEGRWLMHDATLQLSEGSLTALVGPNGSGKTTLLRLLAGLWQPSEGRVLLNDCELGRLPRREFAQHVAYTPQDTQIEFAFTVRDVVTMGRNPHLGRFERERASDRQAVLVAMERADCLHLADRLVTELSGGERQRVVIARSLATEAQIILLDEPIANLDIRHALDTLELCRELVREGKTVALAVHDLNLAARYATEVVLVSAGRIVATGAPSEVVTGERIRAVFGVHTELARTATGDVMLFFQHDECVGHETI